MGSRKGPRAWCEEIALMLEIEQVRFEAQGKRLGVVAVVFQTGVDPESGEPTIWLDQARSWLKLPPGFALTADETVNSVLTGVSEIEGRAGR